MRAGSRKGPALYIGAVGRGRDMPPPLHLIASRGGWGMIRLEKGNGEREPDVGGESSSQSAERTRVGGGKRQLAGVGVGDPSAPVLPGPGRRRPLRGAGGTVPAAAGLSRGH